MQDPQPEYLATASLSPVSPTPLPAQARIQTSVVPHLQAQAAASDQAVAKPTPSPPPADPSATTTMMASEPAPAGTAVSDPIVDYPGETHDESDDSIDYGDGDGDGEVQGQGQGEDRGARETTDPDATNDDYAKTFDSPVAHEDQSEAEDAQPIVPMAAVQEKPTIISPSSASDQAVALHPSPPSAIPPPALVSADGGPDSGDSSSPSEKPNGLASSPASAQAATLNTSPSADASTAPSSEPVEKPNPAADASRPDAAPASKQENDAPAIDIQKLVDNLTAKAAASTAAPDPPAQPSPSTPQSTPAPTASSLSYPPSLPPKPTLPNPPPSLPAIPPAPYSHSRHAPGVPLASPRTPHGAYPAPDGMPSYPAPPPGTYPPHHFPHNGDAPGYYQGASIKQLWEQFQADEKRYTAEARWERFPEGSRIFIGKSTSALLVKHDRLLTHC
jgi:nuclear polyadenylated RNA-binding protein 3